MCKLRNAYIEYEKNTPLGFIVALFILFFNRRVYIGRHNNINDIDCIAARSRIVGGKARHLFAISMRFIDPRGSNRRFLGCPFFFPLPFVDRIAVLPVFVFNCCPRPDFSSIAWSTTSPLSRFTFLSLFPRVDSVCLPFAIVLDLFTGVTTPTISFVVFDLACNAQANTSASARRERHIPFIQTSSTFPAR